MAEISKARRLMRWLAVVRPAAFLLVVFGFIASLHYDSFWMWIGTMIVGASLFASYIVFPKGSKQRNWSELKLPESPGTKTLTYGLFYLGYVWIRYSPIASDLMKSIEERSADVWSLPLPVFITVWIAQRRWAAVEAMTDEELHAIHRRWKIFGADLFDE